MERAEVGLELVFREKIKFDAIILDISKKDSFSENSDSKRITSFLVQILARGGYLIVNFNKKSENFIQDIEKDFSCWEHLKFKKNKIGVFRHFGEGKIGDPLPENFVNRKQSKIFLQTLLDRPWKVEIVGKDGCYGVRHCFGFLSLEWYTSNIEPEVVPRKGIRLIIWQPFSRNIYQKGWLRALFKNSGWQYGYTKSNDNYWNNWSKHARRHRERWLKNKRYVLRRVTIEEFEKAYEDSEKLDFLTRKCFIRSLKFHLKNNSAGVNLILARDEKEKKDVAGLATIDYLDVSQSQHMISFLHKDYQKTSVGYGLIDNWFLTTKKREIAWLDFGIVWKKGNSSDWKNYSNFKRQFGLYLINQPRNYLKLTIGLK
jgi:hypothetical protein